MIGLPDRNRTCDPQLRRLLLYPTELRAVMDADSAVDGAPSLIGLQADGQSLMITLVIGRPAMAGH